MKTRFRYRLLSAPDFTPLAVLGVSLLFFLWVTTRPKSPHGITVDLPRAYSYEGCMLWDSELPYLHVVIQDATHVYLQEESRHAPVRTTFFVSVCQMNTFLEGYLPKAIQHFAKDRMRIFIKANQKTQWRELAGVLKVLQQAGFRKYNLWVEPGRLTDKRHPFYPAFQKGHL